MRPGHRNLLLRTDKPFEDGRYPRAGYLVSLEEAPAATARVLGSGRIPLLLEPSNKYGNLHGINVVFRRDADECVAEAVGPGFDVSDLNRGDLAPHEQVVLRIRRDRVTEEIVRRSVTNVPFAASVAARLVKVARDLQNWGAIPASGTQPEGIAAAREYLRVRRWDLLLRQTAYGFVSPRTLNRLVSYLRDLPRELWFGGAPSDLEVTVSVSVVPHAGAERFIFWDITRASTKYAGAKSLAKKPPQGLT